MEWEFQMSQENTKPQTTTAPGQSAAPQKGSLMAAFRKAMPVTHFVTKWSSYGTAAAGGIAALVTTGLMMGAGAGPLALVGGLFMGVGVVAAVGINAALPLIGISAIGEGSYKLIKNAQDNQKEIEVAKATAAAQNGPAVMKP